MSLRLVVDMNLSPDWVPALSQHGYAAVHWSTVGNPRAVDTAIMAWANANQHVVFTHDLDFGTLLALTHAGGPSVIQLRTRNVLPDQCLNLLLAALQQHAADLSAGALVVIDEANSRVRVLPF
jgi:predicted nuclease of predicted toxin-antitoxin system